MNGRELSREIDLYEGFHFHVRYLGEKLFVGIKLAHKYVDTAWAVDRFSADELKNLKMRMFLYHFGSNWFTIQLLEALGKSIEETRFIPNGSDEAVSVFDYTIEKVGKNSVPWIRSLDPKSPAILYRYQGRDQRLFAALALAKLIHRTEDDGARELHRLSIKNPEDRFTFSLDVIRQYFRGINFFGAELRIQRRHILFGPMSIRFQRSSSGRAGCCASGKTRRAEKQHSPIWADPNESLVRQGCRCSRFVDA